MENEFMRTNGFLEQYPPDSPSWNGKVALSFSYPSTGWIQLAVMSTTFVQNIVVYFSNVFDPFPDFLRWLNEIVDGKLPSDFMLDEEGKYKKFSAIWINDEEFIFEITQPYWEERKLKEKPIYLYVQVEKKQFLSEFLRCWDDFLQNKYDPLEWEDHGSSLRDLDVSKIRAFVEDDFA